MHGVIQQQFRNADSENSAPEATDHVEGTGKLGHGRESPSQQHLFFLSVCLPLAFFVLVCSVGWLIESSPRNYNQESQSILGLSKKVCNKIKR